jgi:hypothetical protein
MFSWTYRTNSAIAMKLAGFLARVPEICNPEKDRTYIYFQIGPGYAQPTLAHSPAAKCNLCDRANHAGLRLLKQRHNLHTMSC